MHRNIFSFLLQLKATALVIIGGIPTGAHYGWTAPIIPIYTSPNATFQISEMDKILFEATYLLSELLLFPLTAMIIEKYGTRISIVIAAIGNLMAFVLIGTATSPIYFHVARFIAGAICPMSYMATPIYIAEISSKNVRGILCSINNEVGYIGVLTVYALVSYCPFWVHAVFESSLSIIQIIAITFSAPESPYFLIKQKKFHEAELTLKSMRAKSEDINDEFEEILKTIQKQEEYQGKPWDLFIKKTHRKVFLVVTILAACVSLTGFVIISMDLHSILSRVDTVLPYQISAIVFSGMTCIGIMIGSSIIDFFGRKPLLIFSSILTGLILIFAGAYFHLELEGFNVDMFSWVIPVSMMSYALVVQIGLANIPRVYFAELFAQNVYSLFYAFEIYTLFGLFSVLIYNGINKYFEIHISLYFFSFMAFITAIFTYFHVPETKGKTLDEIQVMFQGK